MEIVGSKSRASMDPILIQSKWPRLEQSPHPQSLTYGKPMPFDLQCKIFLSHSGRDKEFVRHLHKALCSSYHGIDVAFFDEESIPKAEAVTMENILQEARTSKLGVLVLTDDFFMHTRNPMLELEAFVAAGVKLLPLFFTMSVDQFKEKERRDRWVTKWREWSAGDDKLLESWGRALSLVSTFCGVEFCKTATNQSEYIEKVVKEVTRKIGPALPLSQPEAIHGKDRLCEMVDDMYEKAAKLKRFSSVQNTSSTTQAASTSASNPGLEEDCTCYMVGIHGFTGLGKTTLCKWLCDFYHPELSGRVCYIDVGSQPASPEENSSSFGRRLEHVLSTLSPGNNYFQNLSNDQLKNALRNKFSSMRDPVFLAIDNILEESQEEAGWYLGCEFPKGSKIFLTSRSESILANLSDLHKYNFSVEIAYMPLLTREEARNLFVHEFPKRGLTDEQEDQVKECVDLCTIDNKQYDSWIIDNKQYHPLMLKSLAAFIKYDRSSALNVGSLKEKLAKLQSEGIKEIKDEVWSKVFSVFELTYGLLSGAARKVFLDMALFHSTQSTGSSTYKWINMLHSHLGQKELKKIILQLQDRCFIESYWPGYIEIRDLLVDFGKFKARHEGEDLNTRSGQTRTYVVMDDNTQPEDYHLPSSARYISISGVQGKASDSLLDLRKVEGVEVLHLVRNAGLQEVLLSPTTFAHLRSLIVIVPKFTRLHCILYEADSSRSSRGDEFDLEWMQVEGNVSFTRAGASQLVSGILGLIAGSSHTAFSSLTMLKLSKVADRVSNLVCPCNLEGLELISLPNVQSIDTTPCAKLKGVALKIMESLKSVHGLERHSRHLQIVDIEWCNKLSALTISGSSGADYYITNCKSLKTISFWAESGAECRRTSGLGGDMNIRYSCTSFQGVADGLAVCTRDITYCGRIFMSFFGVRSLSEVRLKDFFGHFPIKDAGVDCSLCTAKVVNCKVSTEYSQAWLAGVKSIELEDAQHSGVFISALFEAQPEQLRCLVVTCKRGGDCGCDHNAPVFGVLPLQNELPAFFGVLPLQNELRRVKLMYSCPQVRDLASLAQWHVLTYLYLNGCTSVEVWPDFAAMTSLEKLDLSNTSLKKWPCGVRLLPRLRWLNLRGCRELPAKELIMSGSTIAVPESMTSVHLTCKLYSLKSLSQDLRDGTRDKGSVADDLDALSLQLVLLFKGDGWLSSNRSRSIANLLLAQKVVVGIMSPVWRGDFPELEEKIKALISATEKEWQYIRTEMRRLLCSKIFYSLFFDDSVRFADVEKEELEVKEVEAARVGWG